MDILNKKKVSIIGTNGLPAKYGGFETLTNYLSQNLSTEYEVSVYCSKTKKNKRLNTYNNSSLRYLPFKANGWQSMIYDAISIVHSLYKDDVLIILGFSGVLAFPLNIFFHKKIIFNIGGIEWQKVRGNKSTAKIEIYVKKIFEKICVKFSDVVIVDNQVLFDYVIKTYSINPVLAEYGGDHAKKVSISDILLKKYNFLNQEYDVTISRAQPDMNIHLVLESYTKIKNRTIVIVSNWSISDYGINLKNQYKDKYENIIILDAIYDLDELNAIRSNASLYLHTHSLCGTAPSLVEAMNIGLPVVCFDVPTNRSTTEEKSLYFNNPNELSEILENIDSKTLEKLSINMSEIAKRRYTWEKIVNAYKNII